MKFSPALIAIVLVGLVLLGADTRQFSHEAKAAKAGEAADLLLPASDLNYSPASSYGTPSVWTQECSPTVAGTIRVTFVWTPSISGPQWLDLSLSDNGFAPGTFVGVGPLAASEQVFAWDGLRPAATHYVRLDTLYAGHWYPSGTLIFKTGICGGPALLGPLSASCNLFTSDTTFSWTSTVPQGSVQWLDLSVYNNGFASGTLISAGPFPPNTTWFTWKGLRAGTTHYWRVNTLTPAGWHSSTTGTFTTGCAPVQYAPPGGYCCKICTKGKACGNTCISRSYTCHVGPGCACNG
jgi:hypothetical protein